MQKILKTTPISILFVHMDTAEKKICRFNFTSRFTLQRKNDLSLITHGYQNYKKLMEY